MPNDINYCEVCGDKVYVDEVFAIYEYDVLCEHCYNELVHKTKKENKETKANYN